MIKNNGWIKLKDQFPDEKTVGEKVLLHRVTTGPQTSQAISVYSTRMIIYCNPDETHWMPLPEPPK